MKRAIVLSAGLGTRLRPLTDWVPKPLVWLGDRPQIDHVLAALARAGFERVVVNTHHLADQFDDAWAARQPVAVVRLHEPSILGTGGGIANARGALGDDDVLVENGDILAEVDYAALAIAHRGAAATLVVAPAGAAGQGTVGLDATGAVVRLRGRRFGLEVRGADYIGVAALSGSFRATLPAAGCLVGDGLLPWLSSGGRVGSFVHDGGFRDTGSLEDYLAANLAWLGARSSFVAEGAIVAEGVVLHRCVVGPGARVRGEGELSDVVVWPGAEARVPLERAVVAPRGTILVR